MGCHSAVVGPDFQVSHEQEDGGHPLAQLLAVLASRLQLVPPAAEEQLPGSQGEPEELAA